jgi:hypothetical protein
MSRNLSDKQKQEMKKKIWKAIEDGSFTLRDFANKYGCSRETIRRIIAKDKELEAAFKDLVSKATKRGAKAKHKEPFKDREVEHSENEKTLTVTTRSLDIKTLDDALRISEVDLKIWEVDRFKINSWEVTVGGRGSGTGQPETFTNYQVAVWLKRKTDARLAIDEIYDMIKTGKQVIPVIKRIKLPESKHQRQLEISIMDLHLGLRCFKGASDHSYSPEDAGSLMMTMLDNLIDLAKIYAPYEKIIFVIGNDFLHADNFSNTTSSFTPQPEADAWQNTFLHGERLGLAIVERLRQEAPVKIIAVPGNHARQSEISLSRIINAYYHKDKDVEVDAGLSPYKFHLYGVNLLGFEHGHSIRQQVRLAALMANECRLEGWQQARYCEWHLGDQHRKASGKPMHFEEQGVSVEFLPGLVVPNEWHRLHSFNWQKRAGMAFVWDKTAGPISRFQVNVDNYTGKIMK